MYKQAVREKLRFVTPKGNLSIEQLWDLSQTDLANAIRSSHEKIKKDDSDELSFLSATVSKKNKEELTKFEILKDIYETKREENAQARTAKERKEKKQQLLAILERKQLEKTEALTEEELKVQIAALD